MGQEETRIIRRGGNHGEKDEGEGQSLVTTPSKAIDVGLPLTLNSLAYDTGEQLSICSAQAEQVRPGCTSFPSRCGKVQDAGRNSGR